MKILAMSAMILITVLSTSTIALATTTTLPDVAGPLGTAVTGVVAEGINVVGVIFPVVLGLVGAIVVWRLGIRLFRSAVN
jgi:hypothetical protein